MLWSLQAGNPLCMRDSVTKVEILNEIDTEGGLRTSNNAVLVIFV